MSIARPAPIIACRRIADDALVLHVIDHGVCAAVTLSRRRALQLVHDLLVAAVPEGARSAAASRRVRPPRGEAGRRR